MVTMNKIIHLPSSFITYDSHSTVYLIMECLVYGQVKMIDLTNNNNNAEFECNIHSTSFLPLWIQIGDYETFKKNSVPGIPDFLILKVEAIRYSAKTIWVDFTSLRGNLKYQFAIWEIRDKFTFEK